jgi:hypothetical protein
VLAGFQKGQLLRIGSAAHVGLGFLDSGTLDAVFRFLAGRRPASLRLDQPAVIFESPGASGSRSLAGATEQEVELPVLSLFGRDR